MKLTAEFPDGRTYTADLTDWNLYISNGFREVPCEASLKPHSFCGMIHREPDGSRSLTIAGEIEDQWFTDDLRIDAT